MKQDQVVQMIYKAIDEVNKSLTQDVRLEKKLDEVLNPAKGKLSSLGLIQLIVAIEQEFAKETSEHINLSSSVVFEQEVDPFENIETLTHYIISIA